MLKITRQGNILVSRDENDKPVQKAVVSPKMKKKHLAQIIKEITTDNVDTALAMRDLAMGVPYIPVLPDGRRGEPVIPSPEVRRAAIVNLWEYSEGKPVAITEMTAAAIDQDLRAKYESMSDEDLEEAIRQLKQKEEEELLTLERVPQKELP